MTDRAIETSPQTYARIGGVLYLIIIVAGFFAEFFFRSQGVIGRSLLVGLAGPRFHLELADQFT